MQSNYSRQRSPYFFKETSPPGTSSKSILSKGRAHPHLHISEKWTHKQADNLCLSDSPLREREY